MARVSLSVRLSLSDKYLASGVRWWLPSGVATTWPFGGTSGCTGAGLGGADVSLFAERDFVVRACSQACGHSKPGLLPQFNHDAIFVFLDGYGHCGLPARRSARVGANLDDHFVTLPKRLRLQVALVELAKHCLCNVYRFDFSVKNSSFHEVDYNRLCDSP